MPDGSAKAHIYRPKLFDLVGEGYSLAHLRADVLAGLAVAIVALPLSMAIAVASQVSPDRGLIAAIVGGFLVSALGGSGYQIGGPAGTFIVLVSATVGVHGLAGLILAVLMSGVLLTILGVTRLGSLVRFMPSPVTVGFTVGVAITIFASQLQDLAGLTLADAEPAPPIPKLISLAKAVPTANLSALALGVATALGFFALQRWRPAWPSMLIAVMLGSVVAAVLGLQIETIGSRFGSIAAGLPAPSIPEMDATLALAVLPSALSFTLLGAVNSLLSAKIADGMTGRKHRYNMEVVAQGIANIASAIFGGISVTGTIDRTATNIRAGARSPLAGIIHAGFLLMFLIAAAPLANAIPLSALAGVLMVVCWNMAAKKELAALSRRWSTGSILLATLGLTLMKDLTWGILAGCLLAALFAVMRKWRT